MAKKPNSTDEQTEATMPKPPTMDLTAWEQKKVQEYGGSSQILALEVGDIVGPLIYGGHHPITTDLGETTVHVATDDNGESWRLPISATFLRAIDQSQMTPGDRFAARRLTDVLKKRGKGAGKPMAIYSIKVFERKAATPAPF
jgi:hypothetical protein